MNVPAPESPIQRRLVEALYVEAMLLADEARHYFDEAGRADRDALPPALRVGFSCESLKVTTRLMHVIAWLLTQRAVLAGELRSREALDPSRRLGLPPTSDPDIVAILPPSARALIRASMELHRRVARLDDAQSAPPSPSPVRALQERLALVL